MSEVTKADIDELHRSIQQLPETIFKTKIKVNNGIEREVEFIEVVKDSHTKIITLQNDLTEGNIWVSYKDKTGQTHRVKQIEFFSGLINRPFRWFSDTATFSDKLAKIVVGLGILITAGFILYKLINNQ